MKALFFKFFVTSNIGVLPVNSARYINITYPREARK
jgi:hypothetical protein